MTTARCDDDALQSLLQCFALHPSQPQRTALVWRDNSKHAVYCQHYRSLMPWPHSRCAAQAVSLPMTYGRTEVGTAEHTNSEPHDVLPQHTEPPDSDTGVVVHNDEDDEPAVESTRSTPRLSSPSVRPMHTLPFPAPPPAANTTDALHTPEVCLGAPLDALTIRQLLRRCEELARQPSHAPRSHARKAAEADMQALAALFPLLHHGVLYCSAAAFLDHCAHDDEHLFLCETMPWYPIHECPRQQQQQGHTPPVPHTDDEEMVATMSEAALPFFTLLYGAFLDAWQDRVPRAAYRTIHNEAHDVCICSGADANCEEAQEEGRGMTCEAHVGLWCGFALANCLARQIAAADSIADDLLQLIPASLRVHHGMLLWWHTLQAEQQASDEAGQQKGGGDEEEEDGESSEDEVSELQALHYAASLWCAADSSSATTDNNKYMTPAQLNEARVRFFFSEVAPLLATALVQQSRRAEKEAAIAKAMNKVTEEKEEKTDATRSPSHASPSQVTCGDSITPCKRPRIDSSTQSECDETEPSVLRRRNELLLFMLLHEPQSDVEEEEEDKEKSAT